MAKGKTSAGILVYRMKKQPEILLIHPGGPFWANRNEGAWSIPKGEISEEEEGLKCAVRELKEETGMDATPPFIELGSCRLKSGKRVYAWAMESDFDAADLKSNLFEMEWPPRSGKLQSFPEADKAAWFTFSEARKMINIGQIPFIDRLEEHLQSRRH